MKYSARHSALQAFFHCFLFLALSLSASAYTGSWPPSTSLVPDIYSVPVEATAIENPPAIRLKFYLASTYDIYRKAPDVTTWGNPIATGVSVSSGGTWDDASVTIGQLYEYKLVSTACPEKLNVYSRVGAGTYDISKSSDSGTTYTPYASGVVISSASQTWADPGLSFGQVALYKFVRRSDNMTFTQYMAFTAYSTGYILCGIKVDRTQPKGRMAIVVSSDVPTKLPAEYAQYKEDLVADGWLVDEIVCTRAKDSTSNGIGGLVRSPSIKRVSQDLFRVGFRARSETVGLVHWADFSTSCQMSDTDRSDKSPDRTDRMRGSRNASSSLSAPASSSPWRGSARDRKYSFSDLPARAAIALSCRC
jgi:hypothetical protein